MEELETARFRSCSSQFALLRPLRQSGSDPSMPAAP